MGFRTKTLGRGRWRFFRHDAGQAAGPPAWAYVLLFAACQLLGQWSLSTLHVMVMWPANAVLLAAVLQLHRRPALAVLVCCFSVNLIGNVFRGQPDVFTLVNAVLNLVQVLAAALLARRLCGAALDMRRPARLFRFALGAAVPAVALSTALAGVIALATGRLSPEVLSFRLHHLFDMELLAMMIFTPSLLLLARSHRFSQDAVAPAAEVVALMGLVVIATVWGFGQTVAPILFVVFPPLILLAFRLSPPWTALAVIAIAVIGGAATVTGHGPVTQTHVAQNPALSSIPLIMRQMNVFHLFLLMVVATALPITTLSSERRRLVAQLRARTAAALGALQRAEAADVAKSRFLALMSHEMRTPLTGVTGYADLLAQRPCLDEEGRRQVEALRLCGEAMLRLVEDLLEVSRGGGEVMLRPIDVRALIDEAVAPAREWAAVRGLDFTVSIAPEAEGTVLTDARRLRQTLHHLSGNAVKFTSRGGVDIAVDRVDERLRIAVRDTGCGMGDAVLSGVFSLFAQADASTSRAHEGAGVGLALAKTHIDRLGGTIGVESVQWTGTTFTLILPAEVVAAAAREADAPRDDGRIRVLIVDDHPANRDLLRIMLQAADCETTEARDGQEALDAVAAGAFDLVLMDVRMPVMDGLAATRAIRALDAPVCDLPILAVTAEAMPEDAARCLAAGMDGHLAKPVTQARLYAAVTEVLDAAAERAATAQTARAA
ncbi:response regulator [Brevundimonas sp.]|uniref:hybrid sensor histidine kinase/response regulator n=1 Tax=Brevundimonas sp. TaxID=1871086 RepID=UPI0028B2209B|nr:response regulator [Brevundimonas sp.]